jgi:hypothetical protein
MLLKRTSSGSSPGCSLRRLSVDVEYCENVISGSANLQTKF